MTAADVFWGVVLTSGAIGFAFGMWVGMLGQVYFVGCACREKTR